MGVNGVAKLVPQLTWLGLALFFYVFFINFYCDFNFFLLPHMTFKGGQVSVDKPRIAAKYMRSKRKVNRGAAMES